MNMRDLFPGYYQPTEEKFAELWKECIFSFDTNVLLHIYRYSSNTRERLFDILQKFQERIWIPHQVAYEIHKNRLTVISDQSGAYKEIQNILDKNLAIGTLKTDLFKNFKRHPFIDVKQIIEDIEGVINKVKDYLQAAKQEHPDFLENDELWEQLIAIIDGKVGQAYSKEKLKEIYKNSDQRFKDLIPPGYKDDDRKKGDDKYGDVVLWLQLIDYAKSEKKPIIFVTDDDKEDWWLKHDRKSISPRPELVKEMLTEAGVRFYMYPADKFLDYAQKFLNLSEQPEVIEEAREIRIEDVAAEKLSDVIEELNYSSSDKVSASGYKFNELDSNIAELKKLSSTIIAAQSRSIAEFQENVRIINRSEKNSYSDLEVEIKKISSSIAEALKIAYQIPKINSSTLDLTRGIAKIPKINFPYVENLRSITQIPTINSPALELTQTITDITKINPTIAAQIQSITGGTKISSPLTELTNQMRSITEGTKINLPDI